MKPYTYLLVNFVTIVICFIFSFDRRIQFHQHFLAFVKGSVLAAIPFIAWDVWFTAKGVWWFNMDYTIRKKILGLPLEEWLFFICIPFSCVFTYFCLDKLLKMEWANAFNNMIVLMTVIVCGVMALLHPDKIYIFVTAIATAGTIIYLHFMARVQWIGIGQASLVYTVLMLFFFLSMGC